MKKKKQHCVKASINAFYCTGTNKTIGCSLDVCKKSFERHFSACQHCLGCNQGGSKLVYSTAVTALKSEVDALHKKIRDAETCQLAERIFDQLFPDKCKKNHSSCSRCGYADKERVRVNRHINATKSRCTSASIVKCGPARTNPIYNVTVTEDLLQKVRTNTFPLPWVINTNIATPPAAAPSHNTQMSNNTATAASIGLRLPVGNPLYAIACATPAGIYCTRCSKYYDATHFLKHVGTQHSDVKTNPQWPHHLPKKLKALVTAAKGDANRVRYMVPGSTARERWYCKNCDEAFRDLFKYKSHLTRKFDLCPAEGGTKLMCYQIVGGPSIWYPIDIAYPQASNNIATAAAAVSTVNNNNTPPSANPSNAGRSQAANNNSFDDTDYPIYFGYIAKVHQNRKVLIDETMDAIARVDDKNDTLGKILFQVISIAGCTNAFIKETMEAVDNMKNERSKIADDQVLLRIVDAFELLESNYHSIDAVVTRNLKSILVKFDLNVHGDADNPSECSFRQRQSDRHQIVEFKRLLLFLKAKHCPWMLSCLEAFANPHYTAQEAHVAGVVPTLLYYLSQEMPVNGDSMTYFTHWALCRCFEIDGRNKLKLREAGLCSSFFATALYIIREGTMYNASSMINNPELGGDMVKVARMIKKVQNARPTQDLCNWINKLRIKRRGEAKQDTVRVDICGDFHVNNVTYRYKDIKQLIPGIQKRMWQLLRSIFRGQEWMQVLGTGDFVVSIPLFNM